jgi:phosphoribosylglycinamide formyltransferase-1
MKNIAIFASGSGTNAEQIIKYFRHHTDVRVAVILSNKADAGVHLRAKHAGVPSFTFTNAAFREAFPILRKLAEYRTDFVVLAGFLLKIPVDMILAYPGKIINIHPALLPRFGGKGMYGDHVHQAVVAAGETQTGITIHYVNEQYDEGAIIFQKTCPVLPSDTADEVAAKVHELEYRYYPQVIEKWLIR